MPRFERPRLVSAAVLMVLLAACTDGKPPGGGDDTGPIPEGPALPEDCSTLPAQTGISVGPSDAGTLRDQIAAASPGTTFLFADGTYTLSAGDSADNLDVPAGVTLRSASGHAEDVILEGGWATTELVTLHGEGATVAELTLQHAYGNGVAIRGASGARVYGVHVVDAGDIGVAVLPERGVYSDDATIGCVTVTRAEKCGVGIDGVQSRDSRVYGATIEQPACDDPAIRFATGSRDTVIERSVVSSSGIVGVQLGEDEYGEGDERVYADAPCADRVNVGHYGGVVRNVFSLGADIRVEDTCDGATVVHNSVSDANVAWAGSTDVVIANNLAYLNDGGGGTATGNRAPEAGDYVDAAGGDLHLSPGSTAIDAGTPVDGVDDDIDGDLRDASPDLGADERSD